MIEQETALNKQQKLAKKIKGGAVPTGFAIPDWSKDYPLFDYQMQGVVWLYLTPKAILADSTGLGKAQPLDSLLVTPNGWIRMGDISVGDYVIGSDGQPTLVTGVFPQGLKPVYQVRFNDGSYTECCEDHLWTLVDGRGLPLTLTTKELLNLDYQTLSLPNTGYINYEQEETLSSDPYDLGCEVAKREFRRTDKSLSVAELSTANIPKSYFLASFSERLSILHGIMDSAAYAIPGGGRLLTDSEELFLGATNLARSLGIYCDTSHQPKSDKLFCLDLYTTLPIFRRLSTDVNTALVEKRRYVESIIQTEKIKPMQCISVEAKDHLYLTDDFIPTHNTIQALGLLQLLKAKNLLNSTNRAIIIVPASSVYGSWASDGFDKFNVDIKYAIGRGTKAQRKKVYDDPTWEVLLTNYETVRGDIHQLEKLGFKHVIMDESDYIKNHATQTSQAVKRITIDADRVIAISATPIQNSLLDLHSVLEALNLKSVFGSKTAFDRRYHEHQVRQIRTRTRTIYKKEVVGFKNTVELKDKLYPYYLRRTYKDVDVKVPELQSQVKWVEMTAEQKQMYAQITNGFAKLTPNSPPQEIKAAVLRLRQACTSTATVGASYDSSGKFDWIMHQLQNDWLDNKIVVFNNWKSSIHALEKRLGSAGIGYVTMTSDQNNQKQREQDRQKFWDDKKCRVLIGTTAIEKSLNLQCANIQVNVDMLYNPSRHQQLAGRVHRVGSIHDQAWVFSLLTKDTVEEGVMKMLQQKQAISDHVFDDSSEIFEKLTTRELFNLIRS